MIEWVDEDLILWGNYFRDGDELGYPKMTTEARMKEGGFNNDNKGKQSVDPYVPNDIETTENHVLAMPHELIAVAQVAYMTGGSRERQARTLSRRLKRRVSRRNYCNMLDNLHHRIEARAEVLNQVKK
jgi:hypothetical protein